MNFLAILGTPQSQQQFVISANSWSSCLAYCEGTGQEIISIQHLINGSFYPNVSGTNCYQVAATNSSNQLINNWVWETSFDSLTTWIDAQGFLSVVSVQFSNKTYVVV